MKRHPFRATALATFSGLLLFSACGGGGGGGGSQPPVDPVLSSFTLTPAFGTNADGLGMVAIDLVLADAAGNPLPGRTVTLEVTGFENTLTQPPRTNAGGATQGRLRTTVGEKKRITAVIDPGPTEVRLGPVTAEFLRILPNWRFVRETGSDANDGRSPLAAWATLAHAMAQLQPGEVLFVGAGTYFDPLTITTAATADQPLTIRGDRTGEFTGDAGEVLLDAGGAPAGIALAGATHVTLRGLSVRNAQDGIEANGASDCAVLDCRMYENARGLELANSTRMVAEGNRISANSADGLSLAGTLDARVRQNLVYGNGGDGIELTTASTGLALEFNTLFQNTGTQIRELTAGNTGTVANNVLAEGNGEGLRLAGSSSLTAGGNLSWLHTGNTPGVTFAADPLFVAPAGLDGILGGVGAEDDDFRVATTSATLDAGTGMARDVELMLAGSAAALGTRSDGVMDGEGADQDDANLGFHYPTALDAFASLPGRDARMAWNFPDDARLLQRAWTRDTSTWDAERRSLALNADVRWLVQRVSPTKPEEIVAALAETGTGTMLFVRTWDARRWSDDTPAVRTRAIALANASERGFDVEYEALSGEAMLVRTNGATNVLAQTLVNGVWSTATEVFAPALHTGTVLWTELVPRPGTNEMALVALDDQQRLAAAVWDGTQWTRPIQLATQVNQLTDFKAFDAAFESLSGDLVVAWGYSQFSEETRYAQLVRSTDTWVTGQFVSTDALGKSLALASDPTTNRIIGIFGEGPTDDDVGVSVWNGNGWSDTAEMTLNGLPQSRAMELGWLGNRGLGFALWAEQAGSGAFQWSLLNSGGWRRQAEVVLPGVAKMVQAEARTIPGTDRVMLLLLDQNGALWNIEHDGTAWVLANGGLPLATGLDTTNGGRAFDLDLKP
jgi:parallel beta-helix repeat protein